MIGVLTEYVGGPFDGRVDRLPVAHDGGPAPLIPLEWVNPEELVAFAAAVERGERRPGEPMGTPVGVYHLRETVRRGDEEPRHRYVWRAG